MEKFVKASTVRVKVMLVSQCVVSRDGEVEARLVDGRGPTVERHHRGRTEQVGIEEFKDVYRQEQEGFSDIYRHLNSKTLLKCCIILHIQTTLSWEEEFLLFSFFRVRKTKNYFPRSHTGKEKLTR